jgi:hypothetical protein
MTLSRQQPPAASTCLLLSWCPSSREVMPRARAPCWFLSRWRALTNFHDAGHIGDIMTKAPDLSFIVRFLRDLADKNEAVLQKSRHCNSTDWTAECNCGIVGARKLADEIEKPGITDSGIVLAFEAYCRSVAEG